MVPGNLSTYTFKLNNRSYLIIFVFSQIEDIEELTNAKQNFGNVFQDNYYGKYGHVLHSMAIDYKIERSGYVHLKNPINRQNIKSRMATNQNSCLTPEYSKILITGNILSN